MTIENALVSSMDIKQRFGQSVKATRQAARLSQEELAMRIDADQAYVSRVEAGHKNVTLDTIAEIANALNVDPAKLLSKG